MGKIELMFQNSPPIPWEEGDNIPWYEPGFSKRMLDEHLTQSHDGASRRTEIIEKQVSWIHNEVLQSTPVSILDLGCGPGLYANRLAERGHRCLGIDYSPASIEYAQSQAAKQGNDNIFIQEDIRTADFGGGHGFAMLIFGEFNVFPKTDVRHILNKVFDALDPGGLLLLEAHTYAAIFERGHRPASLQAFDHALFSSKPHTLLQENFWDENQKAATRRFFVKDKKTGLVEKYASSLQAYTNGEYQALLETCGFNAIEFHSEMGESGYKSAADFTIIMAKK